MHELSLAQNMVTTLERVATLHHARRVATARLRLGTMEGSLEELGACPRCGALGLGIVSGRELQLESIEVADGEVADGEVADGADEPQGRAAPAAEYPHA